MTADKAALRDKQYQCDEAELSGSNLMIGHFPGGPPVQVTGPPVVHPEPQQELRLLVGVEGAGDDAVVAGREGQDLGHLGNTGERRY